MSTDESPPSKERGGHPDDVDESDIERLDHNCPLCYHGTVYSDGWTQWCYDCDWREEA